MEETTYKTVWKVAALFKERSGQYWVKTAYVWETTREKVAATAMRVWPDAKTLVIRKRA